MSAVGLKVVTFGKYRGQSIEQIGRSDEGLLYLDWLYGQNWLKVELKRSLGAYLNDPVIRNEVAAAIESKRGR